MDAIFWDLFANRHANKCNIDVFSAGCTYCRLHLAVPIVLCSWILLLGSLRYFQEVFQLFWKELPPNAKLCYRHRTASFLVLRFRNLMRSTTIRHRHSRRDGKRSQFYLAFYFHDM